MLFSLKKSRIQVLMSCFLMVFIVASQANSLDKIGAISEETLAGKKRNLEMNVTQNSTASPNLSIDQNLGFLQKLLHQRRDNRSLRAGGKAAQGAMLFVSFSMPEELLLSLCDEAARLDVPVILKGLVEGDFKKTLDAIGRLQDKAHKRHLRFDGLSLDPVWFEQFGIQSVPALVVTESVQGCESQSQCPNTGFDVVYGNVHLRRALSVIAEGGGAGKAEAQALLGLHRA